MNRRDFSALLPLLIAAPTLVEAQTPSSGTTPIPKLQSGEFVETAPTGPSPAGRTQSRLLLGLLPENIRLEAHVTTLAPGAPPEPINHHKHSEIWLVREGSIALTTAGTTRTVKAGDLGLCVAGDEHTVANASRTERASYFVVTVGPPE